jgi:hypothetical protein
LENLFAVDRADSKQLLIQAPEEERRVGLGNFQKPAATTEVIVAAGPWDA